MLGRTATHSPLGKRGETAAARHLRRQGYHVLAGGHRSRYGEIDLIAIDYHGQSWSARLMGRRPQRRTIVFVEVKTRSSLAGGSPALAVTQEQQGRITNSALAYLKANHLLEYPTRFDIVSVVWPEGNRRPESLDHIQNAFTSPRQWQFFD